MEASIASLVALGPLALRTCEFRMSLAVFGERLDKGDNIYYTPSEYEYAVNRRHAAKSINAYLPIHTREWCYIFPTGAGKIRFICRGFCAEDRVPVGTRSV